MRRARVGFLHLRWRRRYSMGLIFIKLLILSGSCLLVEVFHSFIFVNLSWDGATLPMIRYLVPVYYNSLVFVEFIRIVKNRDSR